ncbi:outer membrane lipoprotein LolB [Alcaligenaceae bacterium CGII-47]|nr:outer membrane lipoprotein LolB [Alcaligenaceae bacterium CGII-47]
MRVRRWIGLLAMVLILAACATPQRIGGADIAFERVGRFAVTVRAVNAPAQAAQGGFSWRDTGERLSLDLMSPVGNVLAQIQVSAQRAVLVRSDGERTSATDPDALLEQVWGHAVPVAGLRAWIQGQMQPGATPRAIGRDPQGRIVAFKQDGWLVALSDYDARGPLRLRLSRDDTEGEVRVQLIVDGD